MKNNALTSKIKAQLKQGTKVEFKWHGSPMMKTGRIEVRKSGGLYFVGEHNYENDKLKECCEPLRYYNSLNSYFYFDHFEILEQRDL